MTVSYTHLDVYKRQVFGKQLRALHLSLLSYRLAQHLLHGDTPLRCPMALLCSPFVVPIERKSLPLLAVQNFTYNKQLRMKHYYLLALISVLLLPLSLSAQTLSLIHIYRR